MIAKETMSELVDEGVGDEESRYFYRVVFCWVWSEFSYFNYFRSSSEDRETVSEDEINDKNLEENQESENLSEPERRLSLENPLEKETLWENIKIYTNLQEMLGEKIQDFKEKMNKDDFINLRRRKIRILSVKLFLIKYLER